MSLTIVPQINCTLKEKAVVSKVFIRFSTRDVYLSMTLFERPSCI